MKLRLPYVPYYCVHCREESERFENMFIVEENFGNLFCSEECIVDFYRPLVESFHRQETNLRKEHQLQNEPALGLLKKIQVNQEVLTSPDEIWSVSKPHSETIYNLLTRMRIQTQDYFLITCCLSFRGRPAFVVHQTLTQEPRILAFYRQGQALTELTMKEPEVETTVETKEEGQVRLELSPDEFEGLEQKKSEMLANLLQHRSISDIPVEDFVNYERFLGETVQSPDEAYVYSDREGDQVFVHIKTFVLDQKGFFYLALCQSAVLEKEQGDNLMIPIISFPSIDPNLVKHFRRGEKIQGSLKN